MNVIAATMVDLHTTPLGTRSRLGDELAAETVLHRTLRSVLAVDSVSAVCVLCPSAQRNRCGELIADLPVELINCDGPTTAWSQLVRVGRKWSLDGWRGGAGSTTCFDEYFHGPAFAALLEHREADAILIFAPAAPLFDPTIAERMIEHRRACAEGVRMIFTQAPPGVAGVLLDASLVRELAEKGIPIGWTLSYKPDAPQKDLIFDECCMEIPTSLRHASGRLIVDTDRAMRRVSDCLQRPDTPASAESLGDWLIERDENHVECAPREIEIELTTDDPYPNAVLRPRGSRLNQRGPIDVGVVERIAASLTEFDDALVVLGGFGEPLRHPQFPRILEALRPAGGAAGVFGLAVRTAAVDLSDTIVDLLVAHRVDLLNVVLDAWSEEKYVELNAPDESTIATFDRVIPWFQKIEARSRAAGVVTPIIIPELTKAKENLGELEAFYDGWIQRSGTVCVRGYTTRGGQMPDHSVMNMAPIGRTPCRRIRSRCTILADGTVVACEEDFIARQPVGDVGESSLGEIWRSDAFHALRESHRNFDFTINRLCAACNEWHRP